MGKLTPERLEFIRTFNWPYLDELLSHIAAVEQERDAEFQRHLEEVDLATKVRTETCKRYADLEQELNAPRAERDARDTVIRQLRDALTDISEPDEPHIAPSRYSAVIARNILSAVAPKLKEWGLE